MDVKKFKAMLADHVISPLIEYMEIGSKDCEFRKTDVRKCEKILTKYLDTLAVLSPPSDKEIMKCVRMTVLALNKLNEKTDYAMLETEERDNICELIQTSAIECGLQDPTDDITEQWREW